MKIPKRKIVALIISLGTFLLIPLFTSRYSLDVEVAAEVFALAILGLVCIFFSKPFTSFHDTIGLAQRWGPGKINQNTPPELVEFLGWIFLFIPLGMALLIIAFA